MKIRIEKYKVCVDCRSVGIIHSKCRCVYETNYKTIELEFEVCDCCGNVINDGCPADTEFNKQQLKQK